jgi:hypothetical protein
LKEAVARGKTVGVFQPGPFGSGAVQDGEHSVEGPHYPKPHSWYARVRIVGGRIVSVK